MIKFYLEINGKGIKLVEATYLKFHTKYLEINSDSIIPMYKSASKLVDSPVIKRYYLYK